MRDKQVGRPPRGFFIAGTDTGVGKTTVTGGLLHALRHRGVTVAGMKPVASGCLQTAEGLRNEDALHLLALSSSDLPYARINRYAFAPALAPHIAAHRCGAEIDFKAIAEDLSYLFAQAQTVLVEGVGGWMVPLNRGQTTADLAQLLGLPVVLVVAMRLGCLNHALLTQAAILSGGLPIAGWVANECHPSMDALDENLAALKLRMQGPLLGIVPRLAACDAASVGRCLDIDVLL